jgi:hypothetical protein
MEPFTDAELIAERQRFEKIGRICSLHGRTDGEAACRAIVAALTTEQVNRQRGDAPQ